MSGAPLYGDALKHAQKDLKDVRTLRSEDSIEDSIAMVSRSPIESQITDNVKTHY
jgi:hypothetical protein